MTKRKTGNDYKIDGRGLAKFSGFPKMKPPLVLCALAIVLAGCSQGAGDSNSSYTAARHTALGSHIPQPASADTANATAPTGLQQQQTEQLSESGNAATQGSARH